MTVSSHGCIPALSIDVRGAIYVQRASEKDPEKTPLPHHISPAFRVR